MNLICVTHAYPRSEGDVAGAFVERLMLALYARGHAIHVVAPADRGRAGHSDLRGIPVTRVRYASRGRETMAYTGTMVEAARSPGGAVAAANLVRAQAAEIRRQWKAMAADLVHAQWWVPGGMSAWLTDLIGTRPYVVTLHGTDVRLLETSRLARFWAKRVLRAAAGVTAVSSYLAERVAHFAGLQANRVIVQPMPVEVEVFDRFSRGGAGVAVVGRLTPQKNLGVVLEALVRLRQDGLRLPLKLIGDGPERTVLEARARELDVLDQVEFTGAVPPGDIPRAVGDADVAVFPATQEGFGLAAAEALMLGVPVVALESGGGVRDVVPNSGPGRLVPAGDSQAMAAAMLELLQDESARQLAAEAGQSLKQRLAPATVAGVFESVYRDALGGGR